jgi:acetyltransferase
MGADDVFDAALERAGAIRAFDVDGLFSVAEVLASGRRAKGNRIAIVTNAGGPGVLATDRAVEVDLRMARLERTTMERLDRSLPAHWSHNNPVDILGDAGPERYMEAVAACLADQGIDGVLVILSPQAMTDPVATANSLVEVSAEATKPVLACWMGGALVEEAREIFASHRLPHFTTPEAAVEAFSYLARYQRNQQLLLQVPGPVSYHDDPDVTGSRLIIQGVMGEGRRVLSTTESKALLAAFRIPVAQSIETHSANEALVAAESLGFPVAMKISSPDLTHKSDVGGVRLNITSPQTVRSVYSELTRDVARAAPQARINGVTVERMYVSPNGRELMIGVARDAAFGPVISFGAGGTAVEVLRDRSVTLPPLNQFIAENLIAHTRVSRLLGAFRNLPPVKISAVEAILLRVSEMVCELPEIVEMDLNPVIADERGAVAVDARIVVEHHTPTTDRYAHMAIYPYPTHLVSNWQLADGTNIQVRPIRPEDAEIERDFVNNLSEQSKYFRFMQTLQELSDQMLIRLTQIDYDRELALIAVTTASGREEEIGVARYAINPDGTSCEFAIVVSDQWQRRGLGSRLMTALMEAAKAKGLQVMRGEILANNVNMLSLVRSLGFTTRTSPDDPGIKEATRRL